MPANATFGPAKRPQPSSCAMFLHAAKNTSTEAGVPTTGHPASAAWFCERGLLTTRLKFGLAVPRPSASTRLTPIAQLLGNGELAFLCDPLKSLAGALDPVLTIVALRREQADHLVGTTCGRTRDVARSKIDRRPNRKLVLQRPLHHTKCQPPRLGPTLPRPAGNPGRAYSTRCRALTSQIMPSHPVRFFILFREIGGNTRPGPVQTGLGQILRPKAGACRRGLRGPQRAEVRGPAPQRPGRLECCTWRQAAAPRHCPAPASICPL